MPWGPGDPNRDPCGYSGLIRKHMHTYFVKTLTGFIWAGPAAASAPKEGIEEAIGPRGVSARADLTT